MCEYCKRREAERAYCGRGAERPREPPRSCFLRRSSFIGGAGVGCYGRIQDADDAYGRLVVGAVLQEQVDDLRRGHLLVAYLRIVAMRMLQTALIALALPCEAVLEAVLSSSGRCPIAVSSRTRQGSVVERQLNESWRTIRVSGLAKAMCSILLFRASVL